VSKKTVSPFEGQWKSHSDAFWVVSVNNTKIYIKNAVKKPKARKSKKCSVRPENGTIGHFEKFDTKQI
jgi:hypothetical protein